jgi:hypothetical protein
MPRDSKGNFQAIESRLHQRSDPYEVGGKPVLVPKKNINVMRICVDYTGLNKACPKDHFPLPRIDQVIDSMAGSELLCFLDAYSGYHQITMKESDQLATTFVTPY